MSLATTCCCEQEPDDVVGACCLPDGSCTRIWAATEELVREGCEVNLGGEFQGLNVSCIPNPCPQEPPPEDVCTACCFPDGSCEDMCGPSIIFPNARCTALGGEPQGEGTDCDPNPCPQPEEVGACCSGCICSDNTTEAECNALPDSTWYGPNSQCATTVCLICQHDNPLFSLPVDGDMNYQRADLENVYGNNFEAMLSWLNAAQSLPLVVNGCEIPGFPSCTFRLSREWPNTRWGGVIRATLQGSELASNRWQVIASCGTFAFAQSFSSNGIYESPAAANDNFSEPATATFTGNAGNPLFVGGTIDIN